MGYKGGEMQEGTAADPNCGSKLDENNKLKEGPLKDRSCTDILCIPLFLAHIVLFYVLTFMNASNANPMKLIKPMDYRGGFCGISKDSQWGSGAMELDPFPKLMWSMNADEIFGTQAKSIVCGSLGKSFLVDNNGPMSLTDFNAYCGIQGSTLQTIVLNQTAEMKAWVENTAQAITDPAKAAKLFTGAQSSIGNSIMKEVTKNFNMVCTESCDLNQNTPTTDEWMYTPAKSTVWGNDRTKPAFQIWDQFIGISAVQTYLNSFKMKVWPSSVCPYEPRYCIPTPGVTFTEPGDWNMCVPKLDSGVASAAGAAAEKTLNGLASLSVTEGTAKGIGDVAGDVLKTWPVFVLVSVLSFVIGLIVLVLMRFILAPIVWGSILAVLAIFLAGGFLLFVRAGMCKGQSFEAAASAATNQWDSGSLGSLPECAEEGGYDIEHDTARYWTKIASFVVLGIGAIWMIGVLLMCCRIRLAIAINQVACGFMYRNPGVLFVPIIQNLCGFIWVLLWCFCAAFLLSVVKDDAVPTANYATYDVAYGTADTAGKCTDSWPAGGVYSDSNCTVTGNAYDCWKCSAPRFSFGWEFLYSFFSLQWHNFFIVAVGQCTVAGAVGIWFFSEDKKAVFKSSVLVGLWNAIRYHIGSLAFGSIILAIIATIKWLMAYLAKQAKQQKNKVAECIFCVLHYVIACFEKCVKFLNKNAYIQIALMGTGFCTSAKNSFWLILRNAIRFMVICMLSYIVHFLTMCLVIGATAIAGYFILQSMYSDVNPIAPTIIYALLGWFTAKLFIGVFGLSVDACLQCFIAAEEMKYDNAPSELKKFIPEKGEKEGMCDSCCCTIM